METITRESFIMASIMDKDCLEQRNLSILVNSQMENFRERDNVNGPMVTIIRVLMSIGLRKAMANIEIRMAKYIRDYGKVGSLPKIFEINLLRKRSIYDLRKNLLINHSLRTPFYNT